MLREETKLNYVKCSVKTKESRKWGKQTKNEWKKQKTVINMVIINQTTLKMYFKCEWSIPIKRLSL